MGTSDRGGFISPQKLKCIDPLRGKTLLWYLFVLQLPGGVRGQSRVQIWLRISVSLTDDLAGQMLVKTVGVMMMMNWFNAQLHHLAASTLCVCRCRVCVCDSISVHKGVWECTKHHHTEAGAQQKVFCFKGT